jgi:hypothetical protein
MMHPMGDVHMSLAMKECAAIAAQWQDPAIVFEWPDLIYTAQIQLIERVFLFFI